MTPAVSKHIEAAYHGHAKLHGSLVPGTTPLVKTIQYILFATTKNIAASSVFIHTPAQIR